MQKIAITYDYYTLEQAREIIKEENKQHRTEILYYIKQKLSGLILSTIGIITPLILGDVTISILMLPMGLFLLFTKQKAMIF